MFGTQRQRKARRHFHWFNGGSRPLSTGKPLGTRLHVETLEDRQLLSFGPPHNYLAGLTPVKVITADLRVNGIRDLVTINVEDGSVSALLGNGDGTFQDPIIRHLGVPGFPLDVATGDFDGDGLPDLVIAHGGHSVSILRGNGDGTFQDPVNVEVGITPYFVATGHFQGRKTDDIVVGETSTADRISVVLNQGDGTFAAPTLYDVGNLPFAVAVGDMRGNGVQDLVVTGYADSVGPGIVSVLLGNGDGTFKNVVRYQVNEELPRSVAIGDFRGTGVPDLVVTGKFARGFCVLLGNGDGTFQDSTEVLTRSSPYYVATGALDGSSTDGVAVWNVDKLGNPTTIGIYRSHGDGTFDQTDALPLPPENGVGVINTGLLADLRGDGFVDVVTLNPARNTVIVWLHNGVQSDPRGRSVPPGFTPAAIERTPAEVESATVGAEGNPLATSFDTSVAPVRISLPDLDAVHEAFRWDGTHEKLSLLRQALQSGLATSGDTGTLLGLEEPARADPPI
jgi:hypothetical protein